MSKMPQFDGKVVFWYLIVPLLVALILLFALSFKAHALHGSWTDHYKSVNSVPCCILDKDCLVTPLRIVSEEGDFYIIEIGDEKFPVHKQSVHISEDGKTYRCRRWGQPEDKSTTDNTRCIFYTFGS